MGMHRATGEARLTEVLDSGNGAAVPELGLPFTGGV